MRLSRAGEPCIRVQASQAVPVTSVRTPGLNSVYSAYSRRKLGSLGGRDLRDAADGLQSYLEQRDRPCALSANNAQ